MRTRRRTRIALATLALAAGINVLVAWTLVFASPTVGDWNTSHSLSNGGRLTTEQFLAGDLPGYKFNTRTFARIDEPHEIPWPEPVPPGWDLAPYGGTRSHGLGYREAKYAQDAGYYRHYTYEAGWPLRSMRAKLFSALPSYSHSGSWVFEAHKDEPWRLIELGLPLWRLGLAIDPSTTLHMAQKRWRWYDRRLPLVPMWGGFIVNTIAYTPLAWLLLFGLRAMRSRRRRRKGLCVRCTYDRTGLDPADPCPECGRTMRA